MKNLKIRRGWPWGILLLTVLLGALHALWVLAAEEESKMRLLIVDIKDQSGRVSKDLLQSATDMLRAKLTETGLFIVIQKEQEDAQLKTQIKDEKKRSHSAECDESCKIQLGQALSADTLVYSKITRMGDTCSLITDFVDLGKEASVKAATAEFTCKQKATEGDLAKELQRAIMVVVYKLTGVNFIPPEAANPSDVVFPPTVNAKEGKLGHTGDIGVNPLSPPASGSVMVEFSSNPQGAAVAMDGKLLCPTTPCTKNVTPGKHHIVMRLPKHDDRSEVVMLQNGSKINWNLASAIGWITVESEPPGQPVKVDGTIVGSTPLLRYELDPGWHDVLVVSECHEEAGERIQLNKGQERKIAVNLQPKMGTLNVTAEDDRGNAVAADVIVDGKPLGRTPGQFMVGICSHEVIVMKDNHEDYQSELKITHRGNSTVNARLSKRNSGSGPVKGSAAVSGPSAPDKGGKAPAADTSKGSKEKGPSALAMMWSTRGKEASNVTSLAYSPDGRLIASGSGAREEGDTGIIRLWNAADGSLIGTLTANPGGIAGLAFTKDGSGLVVGSGMEVLLFNTASRKEIRRITTGEDVYGIALSPDDAIVATGGGMKENSIKLWDLATGESAGKLTGHKGRVDALAFSPDGKLLACGTSSRDKTEVAIYLYSVGSRSLTATLKGHSGGITSLDFSRDGQYLVSGSTDSSVRVWRTQVGDNVKTFEGHGDFVTSVVFLPSGNLVASASYDKTVRVWSVSGGKSVVVLKEHAGPVEDLVVSPDGRRLISGSQDRTVRQWDLTKLPSK